MRKASILVAALVMGSTAALATAESPPIERLLSTFELRGTLSVTGGFDSNPEEESEPNGAAFGRLGGEAHLRVGEEDETRVTADVEGAAARYADETFDDDFLYEFDAELRHSLGEAVEVALGGGHEADATSDPVTTDAEMWGEVAVEAMLVQFEVRGTISEYREHIDRAEIVADDLENFNKRTYSAEVNATATTDSAVKPVAHVRVSSIDYLERRPGKPERDAIEYSTFAGVAAELTDNVTVQLGLRRNERFFEESDAGSYSSIGPDVEVEWEANDRASVSFWLNRTFDEPSLEPGLVRDVITAGLGWTYRATERLRFEGEASVAKTKEIGSAYRNTELEGNAEARFALRDGMDFLFGVYLDREKRRDAPDESFTRAAVRTGVEAAF